MKKTRAITLARKLRILALLAPFLCFGCRFIATKEYNLTTCRLLDTQPNRAEVTTRVQSFAREFALNQTPAPPISENNYLARCHSDAVYLSAYVDRGRWQFAPEDIANFESLARKLKDPQNSDRVSQWLRQQLPPATLAALSNYPGSTDPPLERSLLRGINDTLGGFITRPKGGIIYDPWRFARVRLSDQTRELLDRKEKLYCDIVELNERLLQDAYPQEIVKAFGKSEISVMLTHHYWSGKPPKKYAQLDSRLTNDFITAFGDAVHVQSGHGWSK